MDRSSARAILQFTSYDASLCMWDVYNGLDIALENSEYISPHDYKITPANLLSKNAGDAKDMIRTQELISAILPKCVQLEGVVALDEVTRGIRLMMTTCTLPIWVVFAVRMLLDAQDELVDVPDKPAMEMQRHIFKKFEDFKRLTLHETAHHSHFNLQHAKYCLELVARNMIDGFLHGLQPNGLANGLVGVGADVLKAVITGGYFLQLNPVRCGMLKYALYLQLRADSVGFERESEGTLALAHVYMACRQVYPNDPVWPDMEHMLHTQGMDHLFVGGAPKSLDESWRKLRLAVGIKPEFFGQKSDRRKKTTDTSATPLTVRDNARQFKSPNILDDKFLDIMDFKLGSTSSSSQDFDERIKKGYRGVTEAIHDANSLTQVTKQYGPSPAAEEIKTVLSRKFSKIEDTLELLKFYVTHDASDLYFDRFSMQDTCGQIWEKINSLPGLSDDLAATAGVPILWEAADLEREADARKVDRLTFILHRAIGLTGAWRIIQSHIGVDRLDNMGGGGVAGPRGSWWDGDKELKDVCEMTVEDAPYPSAGVSSRIETLYKNWPSKATETSSVILTSARAQKKADEEPLCRTRTAEQGAQKDGSSNSEEI